MFDQVLAYLQTSILVITRSQRMIVASRLFREGYFARMGITGYEYPGD